MKGTLSQTKLLLALSCALTIMAFTFKDATPQVKNVPPQAMEVAPPPPPTTTQEVITAADAFKATLTTTQISSCYLTYSLTNAAKWSNFPIGIYSQRIGITLGSLTAAQLLAAKNLLKAASGNNAEGYAELEGLLAADAQLGVLGGGSDYSAGNYYIALLGTPALTGTWQLYFGGHHLAFANTYKNGAFVGGTPSFRGVEPFASFTINGGTYQPLIEEKDALAAIYTGLTAAQRTSATLSGSFNDLVLGPQKDWNIFIPFSFQLY